MDGLGLLLKRRSAMAVTTPHPEKEIPSVDQPPAPAHIQNVPLYLLIKKEGKMY